MSDEEITGPMDEDELLTCEICGARFWPVWDPKVVTISPLMCNVCLFSGDAEKGE
jgi:hypothetical protein